jgi:transcriptional regulator with XRE-family HTH domain
MTIGNILKILRTSIGLSQSQMAKKLGISQNYLSLIEQNKKIPSHEALKSFALTLEVSEDALRFISSDVPQELSDKDAIDFQKLQRKILSLIIFQLNGEMREIA